MAEVGGIQEWIYQPGARVRARLRFKADEEFDRVVVHFYETSSPALGGSPYRIVLEGETEQVEENGQTITSVRLEGVVPGDAAYGRYVCHDVQGYAPGRNWAFLLSNLNHIAIRVTSGEYADVGVRDFPFRSEAATLLGLERLE